LRLIAPGGVATYTLGVGSLGGFTETVSLLAASPSPSLTLGLAPSAVTPPGLATLTVTDTHPGSLPSGLWYTLPVTASAGGLTQTTSVGLLVGGTQVYLPVVIKQ
jgi:hypothetical protein